MIDLRNWYLRTLPAPIVHRSECQHCSVLARNWEIGQSAADGLSHAVVPTYEHGLSHYGGDAELMRGEAVLITTVSFGHMSEDDPSPSRFVASITKGL